MTFLVVTLALMTFVAVTLVIVTSEDVFVGWPCASRISRDFLPKRGGRGKSEHSGPGSRKKNRLDPRYFT